VSLRPDLTLGLFRYPEDIFSLDREDVSVIGELGRSACIILTGRREGGDDGNLGEPGERGNWVGERRVVDDRGRRSSGENCDCCC